jgi:hypothetical protein
MVFGGGLAKVASLPVWLAHPCGQPTREVRYIYCKHYPYNLPIAANLLLLHLHNTLKISFYTLRFYFTFSIN